ncbi:MAG: von Willebrand factor type A domain-containing protein [Phaeodactylibacter sp.]|nr:von Willebrand factor type A domain-containing protein [Phaeodactylibacter sp.]MCB9299626.1 von Willebrand factor type A domain-containing protein [Lewinellaceae bacterium]HQU57637.1 von Willebrand factor type A domain-containing protein [Saprospiraceae bacterium]
MKTSFLLLAAFLCGAAAFSQTSLTGKVTDAGSGDPIIFGNVALLKNGVLVTGTETDFEGNYTINTIDPGTYEVEVSYVGYRKERIKGVKVLADKANRLDITLSAEGVVLDEVVVTEYKVPLIEQDNTTSGAVISMNRGGGGYNRSRNARKSREKTKGKTLTSEEIRNLPTRDINGLAANSAGLSSGQQGQDINVRGSRNQATDYYIDGIRVSGTQPQQGAGGEGYTAILENGYVSTGQEAFSTFSIDVDKAAYSNVRRFLDNGQLPPPDAVRTEELVNYFQYDYPQPTDEHPFAIYTELGECPWQSGHWLLHIGLKGKEVSMKDAPPSHLVFLIDVSGSMGTAAKLPLVKEALGLLVEQLRPQDRISIVTYAGNFATLLEAAAGDEKKKIRSVINALSTGGGTAGGAALQRAYELAAQYFLPDGNNRVILATDGDFNIGISSPKELEEFIEQKRQTGIYLSALGFGMGNYQDNRLEVLADKGNGNYAYIDKLEEAEKLFITEGSGTLFAIAEDVKLQVEFDSTQVASYRLIGYENRLLAREDFEDDTKDAGELGAGHTVTALYELEPSTSMGSPEKAPATIHFRYKRPRESQSFYLKHEADTVVKQVAQASENFRFSAAVAAFAMLLRDSQYKGNASFEAAAQLAENARQADLEGSREEFVGLVKKALELSQMAAKR